MQVSTHKNIRNWLPCLPFFNLSSIRSKQMRTLGSMMAWGDYCIDDLHEGISTLIIGSFRQECIGGFPSKKAVLMWYLLIAWTSCWTNNDFVDHLNVTSFMSWFYTRMHNDIVWWMCRWAERMQSSLLIPWHGNFSTKYSRKTLYSSPVTQGQQCLLWIKNLTCISHLPLSCPI